MKKLILLFLFVTSVFFSTVRAVDFGSENHPDADRLFAWAAKQYPALFAPGNGASQIWADWYYRYYMSTKNYVGVNTDGNVYVTGRSFDGFIYIDTLQALLVEIDKVPVKTGRLNDTGVVFCADLDTIELICPVNGFPGQDAEFGRDAMHNDDSDGHAGFSFTKLDNVGNPIPASAIEWSCVRDNVTGLIWEVKTKDEGLRDGRWTYTWYKSSEVNNNGTLVPSIANGGDCYDELHCDTEKYAQEVNSQRLCGSSDWRLPTVRELGVIVSFDRFWPAIDTDYFPFTQSSYYWGDSSHPYFSTNAWVVGFSNGNSSRNPMDKKLYIRLVHR